MKRIYKKRTLNTDYFYLFSVAIVTLYCPRFSHYNAHPPSETLHLPPWFQKSDSEDPPPFFLLLFQNTSSICKAKFLVFSTTPFHRLPPQWIV